MDSENTTVNFSDWVEMVNGINAEKREKRIRRYIENHPNVEIPSEDAYFRLIESLDDERFW
jgi:hypothetical protein